MLTLSETFQIPHTSLGPPALAAYLGRLYLIGIEPSSKRLWMATMTADEVFSAATPMDGHYANSRVSAAVANCKLYIAHRAGSQVVTNAFNGSSWGFDQIVPAGPGGAPVEAYEPVIAERSGYLHLLHRTTSSATDVPVMWTYFDGSSWAPEVSLGTSRTYYPPVLTTGGPGLVAVLTTFNDSLASSLLFHQAPPRFPPICQVGPILTPGAL